MINKVILIGNLGKDPEVRHLESGAVVAKFSLATNENYRDKSGEWQTLTEWHNIVVWRGLAERAEQRLKKGMQVYIEGKLTTRKWQDKDGNDRYTTDIVGNILRVLERRDSEGGSNNFPTADDEVKSFPNSKESAVFNLPSEKKAEGKKESNGASDFSEVEDDLPF